MNIYEPLVVVVVIYEPLVVVVFNVYNEMFFKNVLKKMSCFLNVFFVFPWLYFLPSISLYSTSSQKKELG